MRSKALICAAAMVAALIGDARAIAQTAAPSGVKAGTDKEQREPNEISGVEVRGRRPPPISDLEVRGRRPDVLEVRAGKCLKARQPADPDIPPPKLVSTFPANGAVVRPGLLVLRLTFDLPMACVGLLDHHAALLNPCPAPLRDPVISRDRRTFLTICQVAKGHQYGLWLNLRPQLRFTSLAGRHPTAPSELMFETSSEPEVATVEEAIAEDAWLKQVVQPADTVAPAEDGTKDR